MAHDHVHGDDHDLTDTPMAVRRFLMGTVAAVVLMTIVGAVLLRPSGDLPKLGEEFGFGEEPVDATVRETDVVPCANSDPAEGILCEAIILEVTSGSPKGDTASLEQFIEPSAPDFDPGDKLVLGYNPELEEFQQYRFADFQRRRPMTILFILFVGAVIALGRIQGLRALAGLAVSVAVLLGFMLPALLDGKSPLPVALVGSSMIALAALYLAHGVNQRTTVALIGTIASLALTGILATIFVGAARITGLTEEDAVNLQATGGAVDLRGLVLAGVVIGALGVLDDVTVTQVSAVRQLHLANPTYRMGQLYRSALTIGRDHIASTTNTLVLAYAGAALPLLLIFSQADQPLSTWITSEIIAVEIVRTLVGSIGLVASVPITTALAALVVAPPARLREPVGGRHIGPSAASEPDDVKDDPLDPEPVSWDRFAPDDEPRDWP